MDIAFGPVPSRRLGRSLGINHVPPKHCSYGCVYCQVGPTLAQEIVARTFFPPAEIHRQVAARLAALAERGERVDYLTFVPDGEPTLDQNLGASIDRLRDLGLPIAVISNASLIWRPEARAALARADWVSVKVDSVREATWRRINHPHQSLDLAAILAGIRTFAETFKGTLASETMLVAGLNDDPAELEALADFLAPLAPRPAYLAAPHRPPTDKSVRPPDELGLTRAYQILASRGLEVELLTGYEGDEVAFSGDLERDILAMAAVHPLRQSGLDTLLARAGASPAVVDTLLASGRLKRVAFGGETFYARPLPVPAPDSSNPT